MLLMIPATLCLCLLVVHSLFFRPHRTTLLFFIIGFFAAQLYGGPDFYIFNMKQITIPVMLIVREYQVPVLNIIGFLFTFYCSMNLAIGILSKNRPTISFFYLLLYTVYIGALIGIAIEYTNEVAGWWTWRLETNILQLFGVWSWRSLLFFPLFYQFFIPSQKQRKKALFWSIGWLIFFGAWMIYVDIYTFLRPLTVVLWISLPFLVSYLDKYVRISIRADLLQFNHAVSPFGRRKGQAAATGGEGK
ncbi:MAG: hypothetical protein GX444_17890 [Myxococcales bacterium]|nr:hypothetical protein [Myxococcales bacterium]